MEVRGVKFAFLLQGKETNSKEFVKAHFSQLSPARAGKYINDMKYQIWDAYCQHGYDIEKDSKIKKITLDEKHMEEFQFLDYEGAYYLELDYYKITVYFILILSYSSSIFAFFDIR